MSGDGRTSGDEAERGELLDVVRRFAVPRFPGTEAERGVEKASSRSIGTKFHRGSVGASAATLSVFREAQYPFGDDVALNIGRAAADHHVRPAQARLGPPAAIDRVFAAELQSGLAG